ncbi:MAG TPA: DUF4384 domain-containing protein [Gemmatimonadales bacterium]|nr:DUF4384 domain-containing protein [Gemmatimonadales bacterium]
MLATLLFTVFAGSSTPVPATPVRHPGFDRPRVEVWTNAGDNPYHTGQGARVFMRADRDAYVTIFRVDTDGRVRVLFPLEPWEDGYVRGGHEFEIQGRYDDAFNVDDYPGVGYVFAVAAPDPFDYDPIVSGDHWDYRAIADGRVRGDPYVALTDLAERIVTGNGDDWDYDIVPYYVERRYDYPRFLCYDCHSYASYRYWNPYSYSCVRFRIVVFDDPYYYPYRYYGGRRVVFTRPFRPEPRFIFKDRGGVSDDRFVTRERGRPVNDNGRRGVRGADLGGRGSVPVPGARERRRESVPVESRREARPETQPRRNRSEQPDVRNDGSRRRPSQPESARPSSRREPERRSDQPQAKRNPSDWQSERRPSQPQPERRPSQRETERRPPPEVERTRESRRPEEPARRPETRSTEGSRGQREPQRPEARPERSRDGPRREAPRAEPSRGRDQAQPKSSGKPELRRRRP